MQQADEDTSYYYKFFQRDREVSRSLGSVSHTATLSSKSYEYEVVERIYQRLSVEPISETIVGNKPSKIRKHSYLSEVLQKSLKDASMLESIVFPSFHSQLTSSTRVWEGICEVSEEGRNYLNELKNVSESEAPPVTIEDRATNYMQKNVFPLLVPALEETLLKAQELDCLQFQKCRFNGIDNIAEILWNKNPKHPEREKSWKYIFNIPFVKKWLQEHPRPYYPKSWLWSKEKAAIIIQSAVRGYLVRRQPEVQEMRQFWKALQEEKEEEQGRRQEETEKWRKQLDEEQKQLKAEEAERKRKLHETTEQEEKGSTDISSHGKKTYNEEENAEANDERDYISESLSPTSLDSWKSKILKESQEASSASNSARVQRISYGVVSEIPSMDTIVEVEPTPRISNESADVTSDASPSEGVSSSDIETDTSTTISVQPNTGQPY